MNTADRAFSGVILLDGSSNYEAWMKSVKDYCQSHDLCKHFNGTAIEPTWDGHSGEGTIEERARAYIDALDTYRDGQKQILELLRYSTATTEGLYLSTSDSREQLDIIESLFCKPSTGNRVSAMTALLDLQLEDSCDGAGIFFSKLEVCFDRLAKYGTLIPDETRVTMALAKIEKRWPGFVEGIYGD